MKLKEYIEEILKEVCVGTVVDFEVNIDKDASLTNNFTGNKVSFSVIKDNASTTLKVAN